MGKEKSLKKIFDSCITIINSKSELRPNVFKKVLVYVLEYVLKGFSCLCNNTVAKRIFEAVPCVQNSQRLEEVMQHEKPEKKKQAQFCPSSLNVSR